MVNELLVQEVLHLLSQEPENVPPPITFKSKTRLVSCNDTGARLAQAMRWKHSRCPTCKSKGGWRIGSKWCLLCIEWRAVKKPRTRKNKKV